MTNQKFFLFLVMLSCLRVAAADGDYAVSKISPALLKNANAVVRFDEQHVVLKNLEKMVIYNHYVITILNEKGDRFADLTEVYDKFNSIESIEGNLYDAEGRRIKGLKKNEIKDFGIASDMNLAVDGRLKVHNFYYKIYPYTVEYRVETI